MAGRDDTAIAVWIAIALLAIVAAVWALRFRALFHAARARAERAERRFALLQQLAPALTAASTESASAACARILERLNALVPVQLALCFSASSGGMTLRAKRGSGYVDFLREGMSCDGPSIVAAARERRRLVLIGPGSRPLPKDLDAVDRIDTDDGIGPLAGSRDRVWAAAAPMLRASGAGQPAAVAGVLYAERTRTAPFSDDELRTMAIIAQLAGDALARALFADEMRRNAAVDGLTGLMTPSAFRERLREELAARRDVGLFFIDTDRFKLFNDTHGHAAGDRLLRRLAGIFSDCAALGHGFAGRNGGDEFCIALLDRTKDSCVAEAERIRTAVDGHELNDDEGGSAIRITVSIGVAHYPFDIARGEPRATEHLLEIADAQMYEAKRAGRNRVEFLRFPNVLQAFPHPGEGPIPRR